MNLGAEFSSYVASPHEALSFYIPRTVLNGFADEAGGPPVADLHCPPGIIDPIVAHLGAALLPALDRPNEACSLFVDQVALALTTHLCQRYGGFTQRETVRPRGLFLLQEQRAKEYLASNLSGDILIADVAKACGLSRGHFTRSFRITTGMTPPKWLLLRRIQQAKTLRHQFAVGAQGRTGSERQAMEDDCRRVSILSNIAREAPLGSLLVAFLLGVAVARRR